MKSTIAGNEYVRPRDGNVYIGDTRVTLDSIITPWLDGDTPDAIHEGFPAVSLAAIYGAIAYYLDHQAEVDAYLEEGDELWRIGRAESEAAQPEFYAAMRRRFAEARTRLGLETPASDEAAATTSADSPTS